MNTSLKRQVLEAFKRLHRTRQIAFQDDHFALQAARKRINEEYKKNKHVTNSEAVNEMINLSKAVEEELKTSVVQAREVEPGKYELRILPNTRKLDNIPFQDCKT
ncbi:complex III assembly factor LYRM7 [Zootermopsis nevadensis]|uniref:LYR motif-containing protein 7 n=1 Tax=Zootermopsis nevadensis TaxID=136037 RepID=A0A067RW51_ZOONE|nr:complex III assembly factor LYRM7 [Zootermopsis nevadensis]KDR24099.1 LYR motif-containing protein 7 [Zootermopsis nevadensis]